jgi:hypothetical protein
MAGALGDGRDQDWRGPPIRHARRAHEPVQSCPRRTSTVGAHDLPQGPSRIARRGDVFAGQMPVDVAPEGIRTPDPLIPSRPDARS